MSTTLRLEVERGLSIHPLNPLLCVISGRGLPVPWPFAFTRLWAVILARKKNLEKKTPERPLIIRPASQEVSLGRVEQEGTEVARGRGTQIATKGASCVSCRCKKRHCASQITPEENPQPFSEVTREIRHCLSRETHPYTANCRITGSSWLYWSSYCPKWHWSSFGIVSMLTSRTGTHWLRIAPWHWSLWVSLWICA